MSYGMLYLSAINVMILVSMCAAMVPRSRLALADALNNENNDKRCEIYEELCVSDDPEVRVSALMRLATIHQNGAYNLKKDLELAIAYWQALADQNVDSVMRAQAYEVLGDHYRDGWLDVLPHKEKAKAYYKFAQTTHHLLAQDIRDRVAQKLAALEK